jgi:uncharacterized protein (UPF0248 family)
MKPIQDVLNQIKWDKKLNPEDYSVEYIDFGKLVSISYVAIKRIEGLFMIIEKNGEEMNIPLHRIRVVKKNGEVIWQRSSAV